MGLVDGNCRRQKGQKKTTTTPPIGCYRLEWACWTNMVSVFRVLWSGCPVSRSALRRKDEQRIRRVAGEQLQRLEASKRTSMQSGRVHADMVHLGLVEGKSRVESCESSRFMIGRAPWLFDSPIYKYRYKFRYKYQRGFSVLGDMRYRRANQTGSLYSRRCEQLELRRCCETERPTAMQPGAMQKGSYVVDQTAEK